MTTFRRVEGECHLCGAVGQLSFEHVPPRAAFNDRPVVAYSGEVLLKEGLNPGPRHGVIQQRGAGAHTLCTRCNNTTGSWYGRDFVEWTYQGMQILMRSRGKPTLIYLNYLFPLPILKQIATMFFSANTPRFREAQPYLTEFVLNRERKYLPPNIRVYAYYTLSSTSRFIGVSGSVNTKSGEITILSEIAFPPFGFVLTFEPRPPDPRLADITFFSRYDIGEFAVMNIQLSVLDTHLPLPGDYRTTAQIQCDERENRGEAK